MICPVCGQPKSKPIGELLPGYQPGTNPLIDKTAAVCGGELPVTCGCFLVAEAKRAISQMGRDGVPTIAYRRCRSIQEAQDIAAQWMGCTPESFMAWSEQRVNQIDQSESQPIACLTTRKVYDDLCDGTMRYALYPVRDGGLWARMREIGGMG